MSRRFYYLWFTTPFGLFQFRRMPFEIQGALGTFQRMMDRVLEVLREYTSAYLDDLIIFSEPRRDHLRHLEAVFTRLGEAGMTAKPTKCQFAMAQCVYLRHVVGGGKMQVEESKVEAIRRMVPPPTKEIRTFLGLTGYYQRFILDYATIAAALSDLTRKDKPT